MSVADSQLQNLIKVTKARKENNIMNLSDVLNRRLCLQQPTHGCVTMLSNSQGCELFHFVLIL